MADKQTQISEKINNPEKAWYSLSPDKVLEMVDVSSSRGLSDEEAAERKEIFGPNEMESDSGLSRWEILLNQFKDPLIYILLVAAIVTFVLQDYVDSAVIAGVLLLNTTMGFIQETKAQRAVEALSQMAAPKARVIRNGSEMEIPGHDLVPGDIVLLSSGGHVAADMRVIQSKGLEVDESALTGESMVIGKETEPMEKEGLVPADQKNMVFSGTIVSQGRAKAVVIRTASATELGKIASSVKRIGLVETPLQTKIGKLGNAIGIIIVGFALLIGVIGLLYQIEPREIFILMVAMIVGAIPEGLPIVLTVTLAIGVRRMSSRQAIIRSLPAVETLGSTTVIGSDKTGTLTKNQMTVRRIWADSRFITTTEAGYQLKGSLEENGEKIEPAKDSGLYKTLLAGTLANEANSDMLESEDPTGDPTEIALYVSAYKGGISLSETRQSMKELDLLPFESKRKYMASLNKFEEKQILFVKGAPESVIEKCTHQLVNGDQESLDKETVLSAAKDMADDGLRVLAMAYRLWDDDTLSEDHDQLEEELIFAGLQGMEDPIRPEVVEAVKTSQEAGIRVIMITGDHIDTAVAIGRDLGLDPEDHGAIDGSTLEKLSDEELDQRLSDINIFARVTPDHKFRIVERLKNFDHIVAVTGDGVNDAPALRAAHIGVSMGKTGTDVAREASDMVLSDNNFATLAAAIEEGRVVFSNVRKVTFFLMSTAVGLMMIILTATVLNWPLPFIAVQIIWMNLVTNGLQDVALAFEPGEPGVIKQKPRPVKEGILSRALIPRLGGVGIVLAIGTIWAFWWEFEQSGNLELARSVAMTQMVVFQLYHALNCRSLDRSIFEIPFFSNKFLFLSLLAALGAQLAVLYLAPLQSIFQTVALSGEHWLVIVAVGSVVVLAGEMDKAMNRWRNKTIG